MLKRSFIYVMATLVLPGIIASIPTHAAEGLQVTILKTTIDSGLQPEVEFMMKDNEGNPVNLEAVSIRGFILAKLDILNPNTGSAVYDSYTFSIATGSEGFPGAGNEARQAGYDSGGEYITHGPGHYSYLFGTALPEGFDQTKTHTVSAQIQRNVGDKTYYANPLYHFVPNGSEVVQLRKVVTTEGCNVCHTSIGIHGGGRKDVTLCLTCHNPGTTDPETGNSVDMTTMIHKIHMGANLPSVQAGTPYQIVGHRNSVHDYSEVHYPQPVNNCQSCHTGEQGDIYKMAPSRRACASCHDDVNFETGVGHGPGIPQMDDSSCTNCHQPDGEPLGISIAGAHVPHYKTEVSGGFNIEITAVENAAPGQNPIVHFVATTDDGTIVEPSAIRTLTIRFAGPTSDITHYIDESAVEGSVPDGNGGFMYAFTEPLPADAAGTYLVTIDNRYDVVLVDNPEGEDDVTVTITADNPEFLVNVEGGALQPRRELVSIDKCNACHDRLALHGGQRNQINNCATCHHPKAGDNVSVRAENGADGGASISLGVMIHKIHSGTDLSQDYTVYRSRGIYNFNHIEFPGLVQQCSMCHIDDVPAFPPESAEAIEYPTVSGETVVQQPGAANCTSCHDMPGSEAHASLNTTVGGIETCTVCHKPDRIAAAHELDIFLNVIERTAQDITAIQQWLMHQE